MERRPDQTADLFSGDVARREAREWPERGRAFVFRDFFFLDPQNTGPPSLLSMASRNPDAGAEDSRKEALPTMTIIGRC